ncbi:MAG TPA: hypothetical protein VMH87_07695 [Pseudomonadales bacterium]|nr:hypothetical protein [Pseudomonadales bacterium]
MSQINDALKRAKKSQKAQPPNLPLGAAPLPPIETEPGGSLGWILLVVLLVAIGGIFIGLAIATHKPATPPPVAPVAVAPAPVAPKPAPPLAAPQAVVIPVAPKPAPVPPTQTNVVVAPPKPVPPVLRLQGILTGSGKPQAIINGQTVYVGDTVNGFRVQMISQYQVLFLAPDGTQKMLALGK